MAIVSVILPVYNAELSIARAVDSILNQSQRDLELIVVDDGSTDGTREVLNRYSDSRMKVIHSKHAGVATASNLAFEMTTSQFVARMDADDLSYPRRLETQLAMLKSGDTDVVGCKIRIVNLDGWSVASLKRYQRWINSEALSPQQIMALRFVELPLVNPTICASRSYFQLGYLNNHLPEDYDLMLRAAEAGFRFGKVDEVLFDWTDSQTRLTRNDTRYSDDAFMQCRQKNLLSGPLHGVKTVDVWGAGKTGKLWVRWLQSQQIKVRKIWEVNQKKIGQRIHGSPVVDYESMPPCDGVPMLVAVGTDGTRQQIWDYVAERGYVPGVKAWFVA